MFTAVARSSTMLGPICGSGLGCDPNTMLLAGDCEPLRCHAFMNTSCTRALVVH